MDTLDCDSLEECARKWPIENILQNLAESVWASCEGEPSRDHLEAVEGLLDASERALQSILEVDSKCRPTSEWLRAVNIAEGIRDECLETIELLEFL